MFLRMFGEYGPRSSRPAVVVEYPAIPDSKLLKVLEVLRPHISIIDTSKLKVFRHNFQFDENGRKSSKWVENTVGKGEIARYEQFLIFPQCFQKTGSVDT